MSAWVQSNWVNISPHYGSSRSCHGWKSGIYILTDSRWQVHNRPYRIDHLLMIHPSRNDITQIILDICSAINREFFNQVYGEFPTCNRFHLYAGKPPKSLPSVISCTANEWLLLTGIGFSQLWHWYGNNQCEQISPQASLNRKATTQGPRNYIKVNIELYNRFLITVSTWCAVSPDLVVPF